LGLGIALVLVSKSSNASRSRHNPPDAFFQNVCELDLVFSFYKVKRRFFLHASRYGYGSLDPSRRFTIKLTFRCNCLAHRRHPLPPPAPCQVYAILDEVFLAGEIEETSKNVILDRLDHLEKLE
jgi:hypothetical protein